ncbi:MAG: hypothetical protein JXR49_05150 [Acidobacteria bacterium]|nr:hypothetical protein [Acidobacteriota bacterium]
MLALTDQEMMMVEGGAWKEYVDYTCGTIGIVSLFVGGLNPISALCAGWGVGRLLGRLL